MCRQSLVLLTILAHLLLVIATSKDEGCTHAPQHRSSVFRRPEDLDEIVQDAELLIRTPAFLNGLGQQANRPRLMQFIDKLNRGQDIVIAAFGGSMVHGTGCAENNRTEMNCAYPTRIALGLEALSHSRVYLYNYAVGGTTTEMWVPKTNYLMQSTIPSGAPDLIMIDFSVNDRYLAGDEAGLAKLTAANEVIVRNMLKDFPEAVVFLINCYPNFEKHDLYSPAVAYQTAAGYYGVEIINFDMIYKHVAKQTNTKWSYEYHPSWPVHELVSKVTVQHIKEAWATFCGTQEFVSSSPVQLPTPFSPDRLFHEYDSRVCSPATSRYDTIGSLVLYTGHEPLQHPVVMWQCINHCNWSDGVKFQNDCWRRRADVGFKFGWIGEHKQCSGSYLIFPIQFGEIPRLTFTYLETYEKVSAAMITMDGNTYNQTVVALNPTVRASQAVSMMLNVCVADSRNRCDPSKEFVVKPHQSLDLKVTLLCEGFDHCKFKIMTILAC